MGFFFERGYSKTGLENQEGDGGESGPWKSSGGAGAGRKRIRAGSKSKPPHISIGGSLLIEKETRWRGRREGGRPRDSD